MVSNNPLIGKQVGNYRILAEINSGSFGSVYQGQHIVFEDDPVVAIKLLHASLRSQKEHAEFIKEAQVLKKLNHPHILHILDAGFQDSTPNLVTEYAVGGSLRDRLKKSNGKPLPLDEAINTLTQIGQALHYAHERHIIHRDLKPENILFNQAGEALLADFGIAVLLASTRTGLVGVSGTPPYMAPEQFEGLASTKSDQYSLGCIAYELVTGHRLYTIPNPTLEAYWFHHAKVEPISPTRHEPQLPAHIELAILTALAKDRAHRYRDIPAFGNALLKNSNQWIVEHAINDGQDKVCAHVNGRAITQRQYDHAKKLKGYYLKYRIDFLKKELIKISLSDRIPQEKELEVLLRLQLENQEQQQRRALYDLVDDLLIQEEIEKILQQQYPPWELDPQHQQSELKKLLKDFKKYSYNQYSGLELNEEEVKEVLHIYIRYNLFVNYLYRYKASLISNWLRDRRTKAQILYI